MTILVQNVLYEYFQTLSLRDMTQKAKKEKVF